MFGFSVIDTTMNTAGMDTKYISATTRRTLLALMPLRRGGRLGMATMVSALREAGKTSSATTAACATMHNTTVDSSTAVHCWWFFLQVNLAMVIRAVFYLYMHKVKITQRCRKLATPTGSGDTWKTDVWAVERRVAHRSHTHHE